MGKSTAPKNRESLLWEKGWKGHHKAQVLRLASLPFREKILWLEEAEALIESMRLLQDKGADKKSVSNRRFRH